MENSPLNEHIQSPEHTVETSACPLCGKESSSKIIAENTTFGEPFTVALCCECGIYYFPHRPSQAFLDDYYQREYFSTVRRSKLLYRLKTLFSAMRSFSQFRYIKKQIAETGGTRILEMGSADGTFLSFFQKRGWEVRGLEINEYMIEKARKNYGIPLDRTNIFDIDPAEFSYDIIALSHVIEHLPDPAALLVKCKRLLAPGGIIFIEVPFSPLPGETSPERLTEYLDTTHLFNFRPEPLSKLLEKSGLEPAATDRFFYPVPRVFRRSGYDIGRTLMKGSLSTRNPAKLLTLTVTVSGMILRYIAGIDTMKRISPGFQWQGPGDTIRIIAR